MSRHHSDNPLPSSLSAAFCPSSNSLLAATAQRVTDGMLEQISQADRGNGATQSLAHLRIIRDQLRIPDPIGDVQEVLELIRFSRPREDDETGHIKRAFCCAALLLAAVQPSNLKSYFGGQTLTLVRLINSALVLGGGLPEAAGSFLNYRFQSLTDSSVDRPFYAFGLVALALLVGTEKDSTDDIDELAAFVERIEAHVRDPEGVTTPEIFHGSFLNDPHVDGSNHAEWRALAAHLRSKFPESTRLTALTRRMEIT